MNTLNLLSKESQAVHSAGKRQTHLTEPGGQIYVALDLTPLEGTLSGLSGRNNLEGMKGDAINAILCRAAHNLRKILARIRLLCLDLWRSRRPTEVVQPSPASLAILVWPWPCLRIQVA